MKINIKEFFDKQFTDYSTYDTYRSLANYSDGLKNSGRKVIHTVIKNNIKSPLKVSALASKAIEQTEYLHGEASLQKVCVSLARDYPGTNNLNLLEPDSSFGNRAIPIASSPRYIYTMKRGGFDTLFIKDDEVNLVHQEFEGTAIEPRFYIPILPVILLNSNIGIGSGFAQKILPREPKKIVTILKNFLKKGSLPREILPSFRGFEGLVEKEVNPITKIKKIIVKGKLKIKNTTTILIEEVPITYSQKSYLAELEKLLELGIIKNYLDATVENTFSIEVKVERKLTKENSYEELLELFNLVKPITENFTCIDEDNKVVVFKNEVELLKKYIDLRLKYYTLRKESNLKKLAEEIELLDLKAKFISLVLDNKITLNGQKKNDIIKKLKYYKFPPINEFTYLLGMPIYSLTYEKHQELLENSKSKKELTSVIEGKTIESLWLDDLELLTY